MSSVIRKIIYKIRFSCHPTAALESIYVLYFKFLTIRKHVVEFHRQNVTFNYKTANYSIEATYFLGGGFSSNVCDLSLPRAKDVSRICIH